MTEPVTPVVAEPLLEAINEAMARVTVHVFAHPADVERANRVAAGLPATVVVHTSLMCPPGVLRVQAPGQSLPRFVTWATL